MIIIIIIILIIIVAVVAVVAVDVDVVVFIAKQAWQTKKDAVSAQENPFNDVNIYVCFLFIFFIILFKTVSKLLSHQHVVMR